MGTVEIRFGVFGVNKDERLDFRVVELIEHLEVFGFGLVEGGVMKKGLDLGIYPFRFAILGVQFGFIHSPTKGV